MFESYLVYLVNQKRDEQGMSECGFHHVVQVEVECGEDRRAKELKAIEKWKREMNCEHLDVELKTIDNTLIWTAIDVHDNEQDHTFYYLLLKPLLKKIKFYVGGPRKSNEVQAFKVRKESRLYNESLKGRVWSLIEYMPDHFVEADYRWNQFFYEDEFYIKLSLFKDYLFEHEDFEPIELNEYEKKATLKLINR